MKFYACLSSALESQRLILDDSFSVGADDHPGDEESYYRHKVKAVAEVGDTYTDNK